MRHGSKMACGRVSVDDGIMVRLSRRSALGAVAGTALLVVMVCGCSANHKSIYRNEAITDERDGARGVFVDANQRAIFTSPVAHPSANMLSRAIVCAEPSPDAITAVSQQFAAAVKGGYQGATGSAEIQNQMAEAVTALGQRTPSIQLLRDAYYRLCEARMDGFITNGTYPVALNRLSDAMVTLLAIEQLTSPNVKGPVPGVTAPTLTQPKPLLSDGSSGSAASPGATPSPGAGSDHPDANKKDSSGTTPRTSMGELRHDGLMLASMTGSSSAGVLRVADPEKKTADPEVSPSPAASSTPGTADKPGKSSSSDASETGVGVNRVTAKAVSRIASMYQFKNLDETCLTLAGTTLQAEFQLLENDYQKTGDLGKAAEHLKAVRNSIEDEDKGTRMEVLHHDFQQFRRQIGAGRGASV